MAEKSGLSTATISRLLAGRPASMESINLLLAAFTRYPEIPGLRALLTEERDAS